MLRTARFLLVALAAAALAACDTTPVRDDRGPDVEEPVEGPGGVELIPLEDDSLESEFDLDEAPEDLIAAVETDLREGLDSAPPYRQTAYLAAGDKLITAGRLRDAELVLENTDVGGLAPALEIRKRLLRAEIHFQRDELDRALHDATGTLNARNIDPSFIARALDIKARVDLRQGRPLEAARTWIRRDGYLSNPQSVADNHQRIWYALGHLDQLALQAAGQDATNIEMQGWLDLAILFLEFGGDRDSLRTTVARWRDANGAHPAAEYTSVLLGPPRTAGVRQIGLLLPLSSDFSTAAQRVYNGFDAAHGTDTHPRRPQVVFYDVGSEPSLVGNYVGVAEADGADVIVGPLGKDAVNALLAARQPDTPMVLLGSAAVGNTQTTGGYQFDLAPETEAHQVAEFMYASGHRRVAAIHPDDEWGQRVHKAFAQRWRELGGSLAESGRYRPGADDFTVPIKNLFNLNESETRKSLLEARSGLNLRFDARRRHDIDALFMAARPDEARLLKPQINFFQGHDLPVYSTSHVFTGTIDAGRDTDLDGIRFPHMPWMLRNTSRMNNLKSALRDAGYTNIATELFAFGFDAYQIALLAGDPALAGYTRLSGLTGDLILGSDGYIHRRFDWAEFKEGVPVRIWPD